jgi:aspartate-semialdehyde dehydrogenase
MVLKPIHDRLGLQRVVVSTYQSVSGTGRAAVDELRTQAKRILDGRQVRSKVYPKQIAFNLLPQIGEFIGADYTQEELKLVDETRRILGLRGLQIFVTTVRVPVLVGHSQAVLVETQRTASPEQVRSWLRGFPRVVVEDDPASQCYPTPVETAGTDLVYVGRIRQDLSSQRGLWLWIVADNLRKGAATNALHIAELLCTKKGPVNEAG